MISLTDNSNQVIFVLQLINFAALPMLIALDKQASFARPTCITSWQKLTSKKDL
jgi:hypothetical protein